MEPIRVFYLGYRIHTFLKGCRNSYNLHDCACESLLVVLPVKDILHIKVHHVCAFTAPFAKKPPLNIFILVIEYLYRNCFISSFGSLRLLADNKFHVETLILEDLRPQQLCKSLRTSD